VDPEAGKKRLQCPPRQNALGDNAVEGLLQGWWQEMKNVWRPSKSFSGPFMNN